MMHSASTIEGRPHGDYLRIAFIFSLILHFVLLELLKRPPVATPPPFVVDVVLEPPPRADQQAPRKQIVMPTEQSEAKEPVLDASKISDRDFKTEREQIKRGADPEAGPVLGKKGQASSAPAKAAASTEAQKTKPLKQLALEPQRLLEKFSVPQNNSGPSDSKVTPANLAGYKAFSRPFGSGAAFLGARGSNDYLPNLPDGDITLLNAKADQFAVFVRRVATQVFSQLRSSGWEALRAGDIQSLSSYTDVRAVLSLDGKLLRVSIVSGSGSRRFDEVVEGAVKNGARDPNPPKAAVAEDGNIHFIFQAKSWAQWGGDPRNGAPMERRWLLLATGLE